MQLELFAHNKTQAITFEEYLYRLCEETVCTINPQGNYELSDGYKLYYGNYEVISIDVDHNQYQIVTTHTSFITPITIDISRFNCYANINSVLLD
jgi:hypothetical protein